MTLSSSEREFFEEQLSEAYPREEIPLLISSAARTRDPVAFVEKMVGDRNRFIVNVLRTDNRFRTQRNRGAIGNPDRRSEGLKRTASRRVASLSRQIVRTLQRQRPELDPESEFWRRYDATHGRIP